MPTPAADRAADRDAPTTPPTTLPSDFVDDAKDQDDDATVVARSPLAAMAAMNAAPAAPPPIPAAAHAPAPVHAPAPPPLPPVSTNAEELRTQIQAIVEEALAPWQRALQNQQRSVLELLQRLDETERKLTAMARAPAAPALPNLTPTSVPPLPAAGPIPGISVYPVRMSAAPPVPVDLTALDKNVIAALEGRSRRRHLILTVVLVIVLLFGGLLLALALSYMPHPQQ